MSERVLSGLAASPGVALGPALLWDSRPIAGGRSAGDGGLDASAASLLPLGEGTRPRPTGATAAGPATDESHRDGEAGRALAALARVAAQLGEEAARLRALGREDEAGILETSQLMAEDPTLLDDLRASAPTVGADAAILAATERHALTLAALPEPYLAARAADVRALGRRAVRALAEPVERGAPGPHAGETWAGQASAPPPPSVGAIALPAGAVVVARDLGPAEVAELGLGSGAVGAIALAEGAPTSHAAIVARSYGLPMVVGLGERLLATAPGEPIVVDGDAGAAVIAPAPARVRAAEVAMRRASRARARAARGRRLPARTRDGRTVRLLCNVARADEVLAGLAAGAEGVGLVRTELAFLDARDWPSEAEHLAALGPILAPLRGRLATVRTLDFGGDKTPPFLRGVAERGVGLTLRRPEALARQLRAIVRAGAGTRLRIKLPLVESADQVTAGRRLLAEAVAAASETGAGGVARPLLGASIETPAAVERIDEIVAASDFLSIGTNDLAAYALGQDRDLAAYALGQDRGPLAAVRAAGDPRVLALIRRVVASAHARGLSVEVCGEAAGDPALAVLLVEAGVDELSMAPPRLDAVRAAIRALPAG